MAIFYLIRHGNNDYVGNTIVGWTPGIQLNAEGAHQAERLALRLGDAGIRRIFSSPLDRALGTAAPLAATLGLRVEVRDELGEVRFGDWTGRRLADLEIEPHWQRFQSYRSGTRAPGGELMVESQARIVAELERLRIAYPRDTIAVVSHADIIRAALVYYLGMPADLFARIEILPGSFSVLELTDSGPRVLALNYLPE